MKRKMFLMLVAALGLLIGMGGSSCKNETKSEAAAEAETAKVDVVDENVDEPAATDGDSAGAEEPAATDDEPEMTLANAPQPSGRLTTWLVAGVAPSGFCRMFIVEGDESRMVEQSAGDEKLIYVLRLVSYKETKHQKNADEEEFEGSLVVNAYDPKSERYVGQYKGEYYCGCSYENGEMVHCGESFAGKFTRANGKVEEFNFYGD